MMKYIENEGALFRGPSVSFPEEVWSPPQKAFKPYQGTTPKPIGWGTVISEEEAREWMEGESECGS